MWIWIHIEYRILLSFLLCLCVASKRDCIERFGQRTIERINNDDDVICTTEYSRIVPLENGEVSLFTCENSDLFQADQDLWNYKLQIHEIGSSEEFVVICEIVSLV